MTIAVPQVRVFQEFNTTPSEITEPLRALIAGPNTKLHRYSEADEKDDINVGAYDRNLDTEYAWPGRTAGGIVDPSSIRLFADDALLLYFEDLIGDSSNGRGIVEPVSGKPNRVRSSAVNFKTNGDYARHSLLYDRDVAVGDRVYIRGVADSEDDCDEYELWTYVTGLLADENDGTVEDCAADASNQEATDAAVSISQTAGATNCIVATADGTAYDGLADGQVTETYTIEVIRSSVAGCNAARLRVTSASGTDNQDEVEPEDFGTPTPIGTRGLEVTWDDEPGACSLSASSSDVAVAEFVVGQTWEVTVTMAFERVCCEAGGTYDGDDDDTYIIEVTKGGLWADLPEITVTTTKGLDVSGPTTVTGANEEIPIGTHGVTIQFVDCYGSDPDSAISEGESLGGDDDLAGLRKGDRFHIQVTSGTNGPVRTLVLKHDLPTEIQAVEDLDLRLFIVKDIEITENRLSSPPNVNFEIEETQIVVKSDITAYDADWTDDGTELPLQLYGGTLYVEYAEWLPTASTSVLFIDDVADLDDIPGQLDEANPLKWGVYRALQNSNGTRVGYIAVTDPRDLDAWQLVIDRVDGRDDVYNFVPLTYDREVLNLFQAHCAAESAPEAGNWKAMFVNLQAKSTKMVVGKSDADTQALTPTSVDGDVVLATLADDPEATGTQYTILRVPAGNAGFLTHGVRAGDVVRYLYSIDGFGDETYQEFVVDDILSEDRLRLLTGHTVAVSVAQKAEIWRSLTKTEIAEDLADQAQSYADRRVVATWPDLVGTAGNTQDGIFLNAALAGLASGVVPHQGLTRVAVTGFDDLASRTKNFFSASQLDILAAAGIWVVTEDRDGTPFTRHALTTDVSILAKQEEMNRRNLDSISYLFLRRLAPFIGKTNVTPSLLRKLTYEVEKTLEYLRDNNFTTDLGGQIISGNIRLDDEGAPIVRQHPLAADRVEIVVDLLLPYATNYIDLHLVV